MGGSAPLTPVGAPPQTSFWIRLHEYFSYLIMHLIIRFQKIAVYIRCIFFGWGGGRLAAFWGWNPKCLISKYLYPENQLKSRYLLRECQTILRFILFSRRYNDHKTWNFLHIITVIHVEKDSSEKIYSDFKAF